MQLLLNNRVPLENAALVPNTCIESFMKKTDEPPFCFNLEAISVVISGS